MAMLAGVVVAPDDRHVLHVGRIDHVLVVGDGVVAEFVGDAVELAVDALLVEQFHLLEQVVERQLRLVERGQEIGFDGASHIDPVDGEHVPVAGLRLLDQGQRHAGSLIFLDVHLDVVGLFERPQERRIRMIAPDQRIQFVRSHSRAGREGQGQ